MNKKQQKYVTKPILMSPYSVSVKFIQSKTSQKIVKLINEVVVSEGLKELKSRGDIIVGLKAIYKLLSKLVDSNCDQEKDTKETLNKKYYIFALKYAEIAEMMKNLPIACKLANQNFFYFPKFIGEKISEVFKVKKCACFAISENIWNKIADEEVTGIIEEYKYDIDWIEDVQEKLQGNENNLDQLKEKYLQCIVKKQKIPVQKQSTKS